MRTTSILFKHNIKRRFDNNWKLQSNRPLVDYEIATKLQEKFGIKVYDGLEISEHKVPPIKYDVPLPYQLPKPLNSEHPLWKSRVCHLFRNTTRILEGEKQALILTKTAKISGLPKEIIDRLSEEIPEQDDAVKGILRKTFSSDAIQIKLPRIFDKTRRHWRFPRIYGIPAERRLYHLYKHLLGYCDLNVFDLPSVKDRTVLMNAGVHVPVEKDGDLLLYNLRAAYLMSSKNLLQPFANNEVIQDTIKAPLPDIYPVKCTIDLKKVHFYEQKDYFPFTPDAAHPFVHTIFLQYSGNPVLMSQDTLTARAIANCYAFTMAQARMIRGHHDDEHLPHPIPIQCIIMDGRQFQFITFQLNTTNVNGSDGIKNLAWIDPWINLYESCKEANYEVILEGYNPEVFKRFLAFYRNDRPKNLQQKINETTPGNML